MKMAHRFSGPGKPYEGLTTRSKGGPVWTGKVRLVPELLDAPLRWRKPQRIFVNSMSDLFHEEVPDEFIDRVFAITALAPQHTFQVLTKRPERMPGFFATEWTWAMIEGAAQKIYNERTGEDPSMWLAVHDLPNVWLGVSVESERYLDRIDDLRRTPAALRFLSLEPLLGPLPSLDLTGIGWVIVGGESGPGARPCNVEWICSIAEQCREAKVPVFVKQLGQGAYETRPTPSGDGYDPWDIFNENPRDKAAQRQWFRDEWTLVKTATTSAFYRYHHFKHRKGGDPAEWPVDLRVREWPGR